MPIASGFTQDPNPNLYITKPGKTELLDENIYYKRDEVYQKPVEVVRRPIIKETIFMPDRKPPPLATTRDIYTVVPESNPAVYTTTNAQPASSFNLVRALGLNADCPCWAWICIVFGILLLLGLTAMCLYFILGMFISKSKFLKKTDSNNTFFVLF
ncbi:unnamed protein product [Adineta steineri]|uniref:Uncharacterized protein n=1 Tax=Adineta steineri TaxID=433720 RepID=A0A818LH68_9BILA|nr:unnamed protein product [Adineta steineri]CAF1355324.1 unnamed protein product [Adineta steineri]CAF3575852.1 unnamed protein product [Adineta steineri]CAF3668790.1 unnamed protein product [Adineta steineri]